MRVSCCVVAADEDAFVDIGESASPLSAWSGIETPGFDTVRLATMHALLTEDCLQTALEHYEPVYVSGEGVYVLRVADALFDALVRLADDDERLTEYAGELSASDEYETSDFDIEGVHEQLAELCSLSELADSQGQVLFVWVMIESE